MAEIKEEPDPQMNKTLFKASKTQARLQTQI